MNQIARRRFHRGQWVKLIAFLSLLALTFLILLQVKNMLVSWLLAFVISYLLGPAVNYMERAGLSRSTAILSLFSLIGVVLFIAGLALTPVITSQLAAFKDEVPKYIEGVTRFFADTDEKLSYLSGTLVNIDLSDQVNSTLVRWTTALFEDIPAFVSTFLTTMLLAPFFAFFMLKDGRNVFKAMLKLAPNALFEPILSLSSQINQQMGQFIRARLLEAAIVGAVVYAGLFILNFPFASLLALFAALTNLIPYIGPIIGAVPAVIIAMINGGSFAGVLLVSVPYMIAQFIDAVFLIPLVVAKIVDLHPVTVVVAIIIGAQLMGVVGMLISIPVASVLKVTLGSIYTHLSDLRV